MWSAPSHEQHRNSRAPALLLLEKAEYIASVVVVTTTTSPRRFPVTRWSIVVAAAGDDAEAATALSWLCARYWEPLRAHAIRRGWRAPSAEDLVQQLLMEIIARRDLSTLRADQGRFRTWLMICLDHLASHERDRRNAAKRGGGMEAVSLDDVSLSLVDPSVTQAFDREWAREVIALGLERLIAEEKQRGTMALFQALRPHLTLNGDAARYEAIARDLNLSEGAVRIALYRLRQRFGDALRAELAETLAEPTPAAIEAELATLLAAARSP
jgi:RNA polymerase sigma-70 factor (ECF subfamily)